MDSKSRSLLLLFLLLNAFSFSAYAGNNDPFSPPDVYKIGEPHEANLLETSKLAGRVQEEITQGTSPASDLCPKSSASDDHLFHPEFFSSEENMINALKEKPCIVYMAYLLNLARNPNFIPPTTLEIVKTLQRLMPKITNPENREQAISKIVTGLDETDWEHHQMENFDLKAKRQWAAQRVDAFQRIWKQNFAPAVDEVLSSGTDSKRTHLEVVNLLFNFAREYSTFLGDKPFFSNEGIDSIFRFYKTMKENPTQIFLPLQSDLDLEFFNKAGIVPMYALAFSLKTHNSFDGQTGTILDYKGHDIFHAFSQYTGNMPHYSIPYDENRASKVYCSKERVALWKKVNEKIDGLKKESPLEGKAMELAFFHLVHEDPTHFTPEAMVEKINDEKFYASIKNALNKDVFAEIFPPPSHAPMSVDQQMLEIRKQSKEIEKLMQDIKSGQ